MARAVGGGGGWWGIGVRLKGAGVWAEVGGHRREQAETISEVRGLD